MRPPPLWTCVARRCASTYVLVAAVLCLLALAAPARANTYEWERTERLLRLTGLQLAQEPEGKRIAWIRVVRDEVFVEDEVWPTFLNWFHMTTRDEIVRRELLFQEGEAFRASASEETMRNLRGMTIFALVRIVAVAVDDPNAVGVVVHTRDLWSLRLETSFNITTQVDELKINLSERNFLGRNQVLTGAFTLVPKSYSLSQLYYVRRLWGKPLRLEESASIVLNRATSKPEGSVWALDFGHPFYNLRQRFALLATFDYDNFVARRLAKNQLLVYRPQARGPYAYRVWRQQDLVMTIAGYLRFGERYKQTWSVGWDVRSLSADPTRETRLPDELRQGFRNIALPRERLEIGPTLSYDIWTPTFHTFENLTTFGQSENVQTGPRATMSLRVPLAAFGSTRSSLVLTTSLGVVLAPGGFLLETRGLARTRYERQSLVDQRLEGLIRGATPVLFRTFRFVARAAIEARRNDTARTYVTLGASNGLRGYTSQKVGDFGASRLLANFEIRTLPIEWQAVHVGAVLFYDVGSVYKKLSELKAYHSVGLGLRVLFPQFNRRPFSFDAGTSYDPEFRFVPTIASEQVVPLTAAEDPE